MFFLLLAVMLVGSYLAGSIPLMVRFSEEKLKLVTVLGAGLLVGTALTVIIPEGIHSLYTGTGKPINQSAKTDHGHDDHDHIENYSSTIGLSLVLGKHLFLQLALTPMTYELNYRFCIYDVS